MKIPSVEPEIQSDLMIEIYTILIAIFGMRTNLWNMAVCYNVIVFRILVNY